MDPLKNEIHPDMVKVWKVRAVIEEGIGILVILAYLFLMIKFDWWAWIFVCNDWADSCVRTIFVLLIPETTSTLLQLPTK